MLQSIQRCGQTKKKKNVSPLPDKDVINNLLVLKDITKYNGGNSLYLTIWAQRQGNCNSNKV